MESKQSLAAAPAGKATIASLPAPVFLWSIAFLDGAAIALSVSRVSKEWDSRSRNQNLWRAVSTRKFEVPRALGRFFASQDDHDWRGFFIWRQVKRDRECEYEAYVVDSKQSASFFERGCASHAKGDFAKSMKWFMQAYRLDPHLALSEKIRAKFPRTVVCSVQVRVRPVHCRACLSTAVLGLHAHHFVRVVPRSRGVPGLSVSFTLAVRISRQFYYCRRGLCSRSICT